MAHVQTQTIAQAKEGDKIISSVAMIVTLVSFGMLFLTLMMAFALFRFTQAVWPPAGMSRPDLLLPTISTLLIAISSATYIYFEKNIYKGKAHKNSLALTTLLGIGFMVSQFLFWNHLKAQGIFASSGIFPSIIYAFTWIHAAHIVAGLGLLMWLYGTLKTPDSMTAVKVSNIGKFWHFLGIVWLIMFVTIFVL